MLFLGIVDYDIRIRLFQAGPGLVQRPAPEAGDHRAERRGAAHRRGGRPRRVSPSQEQQHEAAQRKQYIRNILGALLTATLKKEKI